MFKIKIQIQIMGTHCNIVGIMVKHLPGKYKLSLAVTKTVK